MPTERESLKLRENLDRQVVRGAWILLLSASMAMSGCSGRNGSQPAQTQAGNQSASPSKPNYFGTEPSHASYLPRSDSYCASAVNAHFWEPRPDNYQANQTVLPPPHGWNDENYWTMWRDKRAKVTGNFKGTTTEILQWAACKWGIDEDTIRAAAVHESYWHMSTVGDVCGPVGEASYGILQIKNKDCSGAMIQGGYPDTTKATALDADWYAARMRSCYDGDFYDGGNWLYRGQTVDQIAKKNGWSFVFWGCIGFHYSGNWSPGQPYELEVRQYLAKRAWETLGF